MDWIWQLQITEEMFLFVFTIYLEKYNLKQVKPLNTAAASESREQTSTLRLYKMIKWLRIRYLLSQSHHLTKREWKMSYWMIKVNSEPGETMENYPIPILLYFASHQMVAVCCLDRCRWDDKLLSWSYLFTSRIFIVRTSYRDIRCYFEK